MTQFSYGIIELINNVVKNTGFSSAEPNSKTITITPTDLANGSKSFVVENVIYTYLNNTGVTICLGITKSGVTLLNNGSYTEPDKPDPQDIGLSGSFQISAGTC
jgi:hypothetical protein